MLRMWQLLRLLRPRTPPSSAHVLGYHAEGPFLHPLRRGAHSQTLLMTASSSPPIKTFEKVYGAAGLDQEGVKMVTLAPDVEGVMGCVEELTARGVTVSIGHRWVRGREKLMIELIGWERRDAGDGYGGGG